MKDSHVARSLKQIESGRVTLLEFLLLLTCHQIKTAILITTHEKKHVPLKSKEDSEDWIIWKQLSTGKFRFVLCILLCAIFDI